MADAFSDPFVFYMPGFGKSTFDKRMRVNWLGFKCPNCLWLDCNRPHYKTLGMVYENHKDKIKFVKDALIEESLDDIFRSLEMHPNGNEQCEIHNLWKLFPKNKCTI